MTGEGSHHVTLEAVTLELQSGRLNGGVVITSTDPPFPPCGRAPLNHIFRQKKHGCFVDKLLCGKTTYMVGIYPPRRQKNLDQTSTPFQRRGESAPSPVRCTRFIQPVREHAANIWADVN